MERSGRCLCGAVSFTVAADPVTVRVCWCRDCQHMSANGTVNMIVATSGLTFTGTLAEHKRIAASGNEITRSFCPTCGIHLFAQSNARPEYRAVRVGNLDDPSSVTPQVNIWTSSAPQWACLDPALEQAAAQPLPPPRMDAPTKA